MLSITGNQYRLCDGLNRRTMLKVGGLAMGGLSLPQLLRAEANSPNGKTQKSVIMIFLSGGPPHQDMVDLKPEAPVEYRGEFQPIHTNVPGIEICEHLPLLAQRMDKMVVIRSLVGSIGKHAAFQCLTGHNTLNQPPGGWPSFGSAVSKLQGPIAPAMPAYVSLSPKMRSQGWSDPGQPGYAGMAHAPFAPNASGTADLVLNGMSSGKLSSRRDLLNQLDGLKREADSGRIVEGMDRFYQQAFEILTSGQLADALDVEQEPAEVRVRYGGGSYEPAGYGDAGPLHNDYLVAARRLIESGVRVVSLAYGRWDWHGRPHGTNFENARDHFPFLDRGISSLMDDLTERGMDEDVSVVVWGEFGRTPLINKKGGRDHWPRVACAMMFGGGMRTGQVIGATNKLAEYATERPVHFQEVFATLYRNLGIDVEHTTIDDLSGRPQYLVDHNLYAPLPEVG